MADCSSPHLSRSATMEEERRRVRVSAAPLARRGEVTFVVVGGREVAEDVSEMGGERVTTLASTRGGEVGAGTAGGRAWTAECELEESMKDWGAPLGMEDAAGGEAGFDAVFPPRIRSARLSPPTGGPGAASALLPHLALVAAISLSSFSVSSFSSGVIP